MMFEFVACRTPRVDFKTHLGEASRHEELGVLFLTRNARRANKIPKQIDAECIKAFNGIVDRNVSGLLRHFATILIQKSFTAHPQFIVSCADASIYCAFSYEATSTPWNSVILRRWPVHPGSGLQRPPKRVGGAP